MEFRFYIPDDESIISTCVFGLVGCVRIVWIWVRWLLNKNLNGFYSPDFIKYTCFYGYSINLFLLYVSVSKRIDLNIHLFLWLLNRKNLNKRWIYVYLLKPYQQTANFLDDHFRSGLGTHSSGLALGTGSIGYHERQIQHHQQNKRELI